MKNRGRVAMATNEDLQDAPNFSTKRRYVRASKPVIILLAPYVIYD